MTKVLNIISDSNVGGAGRVLLNYLQYADKEQFETHIALPKNGLLAPQLEAAGGIIHLIDGMEDRSYHKDDIPLLETVIKEVAPDLVHTHGSFSGRIAAKRCHVPIIYTRHSAFPVPAKLRYPPGRWVNKFVNEYYADHIIAVSPATQQNLTDGGVSPKKITTLLNGVAPLSRSSPEVQAETRAKFGLKQDDFVLGILARIEDYKGHLTIAQAAAILKAKEKHPKIIIAGTGPYEEQLRQEIAYLGVGDCVHMVGFQSEVANVLSIFDVQLNASYGTEASSLALAEGMSLGIPSIVSDYGGNPYLVIHRDNGLIFPAKDAQALADCIGLLMDEPYLHDAISRRTLEVYREKLTGERFAQNIESVYHRVLKGATS